MRTRTKRASSVRLSAYALVSAAAALGARTTAATQYNLITLDTNGFGTGVAFAIDGGHAAGGVFGKGGVWFTTGHFTSLHPAGFSSSGVLGISGNQQVGQGVFTATGQQHALLWTGTPASVVDLSTGGAGTSYATATDGAQQVGVAEGGAALWSGTAASYMNLNPPGYGFSYASGVSDGIQVGYGPNQGIGSNALLWRGTASSFVVLHQGAEALGISHGQVVGFVGAAGTDHAAMWTNGTPQSFVDLAPIGTTASELLATNGVLQVGDISLLSGVLGGLPSDHHAAVWSGTASSFETLPVRPGDTYSVAYGIDSLGDIAGVVGRDSDQQVPVIWQAIPEPSSLPVIAFGCVLVRRRRRHMQQ